MLTFQLPTVDEFKAASADFGANSEDANQVSKQIREMLTAAHEPNCGCSLHKDEKALATGIMYGLQIALIREVGNIPTTVAAD